ncbi:hypothetical protein SEVIR_4G020150v4 [Setaria viridis]
MKRARRPRPFRFLSTLGGGHRSPHRPPAPSAPRRQQISHPAALSAVAASPTRPGMPPPACAHDAVAPSQQPCAAQLAAGLRKAAQQRRRSGGNEAGWRASRTSRSSALDFTSRLAPSSRTSPRHSVGDACNMFDKMLTACSARFLFQYRHDIRQRLARAMPNKYGRDHQESKGMKVSGAN